MADEFREPYIPKMPGMGHAPNFGAELGQAMGGFADALKQTQLQRSLNAATDQIQQMRLSAASENEINKFRAEAGNQIGQQMLGFGYGPKDIGAAVNLVNPQQTFNSYSPADIMSGAAGEPARQTFIQTQNAIHPPKEVSEMDLYAKGKRIEETDQKIKDKSLTDFQNRVDLSKQTSRGVLGTLENKQNRIGELNAILGTSLNSKGWNQKTDFEIRELTQSLASVFGGGVAHEGTAQALMPHDLELKLAQLKQYATSEPTAANQGKFVALYADIIDRSQRVIKAQQQGLQMNTMASMPDVFKRYPDDMKAKAVHLIGENAEFKNGKVVFEGDASREVVGDQINDFQKHFAELPKDTRTQAFMNLEANPDYELAIMRSPKLANKVRAIRAQLRNQ